MGIGVEWLVRHEVRTFGVRFPDRPLRQFADLAAHRIDAGARSQRVEDGQLGLRPRQRANICRRLNHLGSFVLHQPVHILAQFIDVPGAGARAA